MQATQISARVNFPEITYDPAVPYQANMASCFARTASSKLVPGNILVLPRYRIETVPPDNNVENIVVPQLFFMVMSSNGVTVYVRTVVSLYGAQNLSPPEDQSFTITGNGNNARGSTHVFDTTAAPYATVITSAGIFLSGQTLMCHQITSGGGPVAPAPLALHGAQNGAAGGLGGLPTPIAATAASTTVPHDTSRLLERDALWSAYRRFLTREGQDNAAQGLPSVQAHIDMISGGSMGKPNSSHTFTVMMSTLLDPISAVRAQNRLVFETPHNVALLLTFQFTIVPVTVSASTSGPVLSGLSLDAFSENFSKTELSYSVNMQQVADRVRDLSRLLTVISRPVLKRDAPAAGDELVGPLLLRLQTDPNFLEPAMNPELVTRVIDKGLFDLRQMLYDPQSVALPWLTLVARMNTVWTSIDSDKLLLQSYAVKAGNFSAFGVPLRSEVKRQADLEAKKQETKKKRDLLAAARAAPAGANNGANGAGGGSKRRNTNGSNQQQLVVLPSGGGPPPSAPAGKTLYCSFYLAHALGVVCKGVAVRDCTKNTCVFTHRGKPSAALSPAVKQQWLADYGLGSLPFKSELLAAISSLP